MRQREAMPQLMDGSAVPVLLGAPPVAGALALVHQRLQPEDRHPPPIAEPVAARPAQQVAPELLAHRLDRRGFARGAIVLVVSDGWDRGDPKVLEAEVRRLQMQARRLVWINPRPMAVDDQPLAIGMRAAMPYIDTFVPGHDPRAVASLADLIGSLGNERPVRKAVPAPEATA